MKETFQTIKPPVQWKLPVTLLAGIMLGLGVYIFIISNAVSYLSDNPETCINCHVMNPQFVSWEHSSHRRITHCNDCHVPHSNIFSKYFFKAKDGMRHASMFTLRLEPQVIQIKEAGKKVVHANCIRCHQPLLEVAHMQIVDHTDYYENRIARHCWDCHRENPHGRVNSLSAVPNAIVPKLKNPIPDWLHHILNK